jgi:putative endonuclease
MAEHNEIGRKGEDLASEFLLDKGFTLLERNWRWQKAEIDIIAFEGNFLVFIEVKTRTGYPVEEVHDTLNESKMALYADAAEAYLEYKDLYNEVRFDFITVWIPKDKQPFVRHYPGVFTP